MEISSLQPRVAASDLPLDRLVANRNVSEQDKIAEASRAFEAILLRQILQESYQPVFKSALTGNTATDGIYRDLIVNQMAEDISRSGSFGLGEAVAREMQRQTGKTEGAEKVKLKP